MTNAPITAAVLKDEAGSYFLVPQETLERGRVPVAHMAEVERLIAAAAGADAVDPDDARGYAIPLIPLIICVEIGAGLAFLIGVTGPQVGDAPTSGGGGSSPPRERIWTGTKF